MFDCSCIHFVSRKRERGGRGDWHNGREIIDCETNAVVSVESDDDDDDVESDDDDDDDK